MPDSDSATKIEFALVRFGIKAGDFSKYNSTSQYAGLEPVRRCKPRLAGVKVQLCWHYARRSCGLETSMLRGICMHADIQIPKKYQSHTQSHTRGGGIILVYLGISYYSDIYLLHARNTLALSHSLPCPMHSMPHPLPCPMHASTTTSRSHPYPQTHTLSPQAVDTVWNSFVNSELQLLYSILPLRKQLLGAHAFCLCACHVCLLHRYVHAYYLFADVCRTLFHTCNRYNMLSFALAQAICARTRSAWPASSDFSSL